MEKALLSAVRAAKKQRQRQANLQAAFALQNYTPGEEDMSRKKDTL